MVIKKKKLDTKKRKVPKRFFDVRGFSGIPREMGISLGVVFGALALFTIGSTALAEENFFERLWHTIVRSPIENAYADDVCPSTPEKDCRFEKSDSLKRTSDCSDSTLYTGACAGPISRVDAAFVYGKCEKKACPAPVPPPPPTDVCPSTPRQLCRHFKSDAESAFNNNQNDGCKDTTLYTGICNGIVVSVQNQFVIRECQKKSCAAPVAETPTPPPTTPTPPAATGSSGANQWIVVEAAHCTAEIRRSDDEMACRDAEADWIGDRWGCSDGSTKTQEQCVSSTTGGGGTTAGAIITTPELVAPTENLTIVGVDPVFTWEGITGALIYRLYVSSSTDDVFTDATKTRTIEMPKPSDVCEYGVCAQRVRGLNGNIAYHWKVSASGASFSGFNDSLVRHLTTGDVPKHIFLQPKAGDNVGIGFNGGTLDYKLAVNGDLYVDGSMYQNFPTGSSEVRGFFVSRSGQSHYSGNINIWPTGSLGVGTVSSPQAKLHIQRFSGTGYEGIHGVLIDEDGPEANGNPKIELRGNGKHPYIDFTGINGSDPTKDYDSRIIYDSTNKKLIFDQPDGGNGYSFDNKVYVKGDVNVQTSMRNENDRLASPSIASVLMLPSCLRPKSRSKWGDPRRWEGRSEAQKSTRPYEEEIIGIVSASPALLFEGSQVKLGSQPNRFIQDQNPGRALRPRAREGLP